MAISGYHSPFLGSVTATTTAQSLYALFSAVYSDLPIRAQVVRIGLDPGAGSTSLIVGNSGVTSVNAGVVYSAGQTLDLPSVSSNLYSLKDIYLLASTGTCQVNLLVVTR